MYGGPSDFTYHRKVKERKNSRKLFIRIGDKTSITKYWPESKAKSYCSTNTIFVALNKLNIPIFCQCKAKKMHFVVDLFGCKILFNNVLITYKQADIYIQIVSYIPKIIF